jgi:hypothetical protein
VRFKKVASCERGAAGASTRQGLREQQVETLEIAVSHASRCTRSLSCVRNFVRDMKVVLPPCVYRELGGGLAERDRTQRAVAPWRKLSTAR